MGGRKAPGGGFHRHGSGACKEPMSSPEEPLCEPDMKASPPALPGSPPAGGVMNSEGALPDPLAHNETCNKGVSAWKCSLD